MEKLISRYSNSHLPPFIKTACVASTLKNSQLIEPPTQHDGLHVLDDELLGQGGRGVQYDVLDPLPVGPLQLLDELQGVVGRRDLPDRLYGEHVVAIDVLEERESEVMNDDLNDLNTSIVRNLQFETFQEHL